MVASLGYLAVGIYTWRRYDEIGSRSLGFFAIIWGLNFVFASLEVFIVASYGVTSGAELASLSVPRSVLIGLFLIAPLTEILTVTAIYTWLWFVLNYTARMDRRDKLSIGALAVVLIFITAVNALVGVLTTFGMLQLPADFTNSFHRFANIVEILGSGVAVGAGIAQLYRTSQRHPLFEARAVPALSISIFVLYLVRYAYRFGFVPQFQTVETIRLGGHLLGVAGLWIAVHRYEIFQQLPASQTVGRDTALDNINNAIVLLNQRSNIADINPAGESLFGVATSNALGEPLKTILPETVDATAVQAQGQTTFEFPNSDRIVRAGTTITTDDREREIGRTIVFNDLTEERRRQQRIQVLNRVLRHNLRNDLSVAMGYLEAIVDGGADPEQYGPQIQRKLDGIISIGNKAREIEETLSADPEAETVVPLIDVVSEAIDRVGEDYAVADIDVDIPDSVAIRANPRILRSVIEQLLENALEHTDGTDVRVEFDARGRELIVSDSGPGIPSHELEVFEAGEETELQHGSGLGLWLVKWGLDRIGGTITYNTDDEGTQAIVTLPTNLIDTVDGDQSE